MTIINLSARLWSTLYPRMLVGLALALSLCGQGFSVGVKAGVPITDYFETGAFGGLHGGAHYSAGTRRYTLGASVEWHWTHAFGFELDVFYHRFGYAGTIDFFDSGSGNFDNSTISVRGNSWDFPIMAKYRFGRIVRPYLAGGGVLRYVGPVHERGVETIGSLAAGSSMTSAIDTSDPSDFRKRVYPGVTVAGGVELPAGRLRVLPELRYTRWTANISGPGGLLRFSSNQVEVIVGVSF